MNAQVAIAELQARTGAASADHPEWQYLNLLRDISDNGVRRADRTYIIEIRATSRDARKAATIAAASAGEC